MEKFRDRAPRSTASTLEPIDLGTLLGVWAHPDDEAYMTAGLMSMARSAGHRVVVATATKGEAGTDDPRAWPPWMWSNTAGWVIGTAPCAGYHQPAVSTR